MWTTELISKSVKILSPPFHINPLAAEVDYMSEFHNAISHKKMLTCVFVLSLEGKLLSVCGINQFKCTIRVWSFHMDGDKKNVLSKNARDIWI